MSIAFRAAGTSATGASTSATSNLPTLAANDLLLAFVEVSTKVNSVTTPSGWTLARKVQGGGSFNQFNVYYRIATGSESAPSFALSLSDSWLTVIVSYSGVDPTSPLLLAGSNNGTSSATSLVSTLLASPKTGAFMVAALGLDLSAGSWGTTTAGAGVSGITNRVQTAAGSGPCIEVSDGTLATSGGGFTVTQAWSSTGSNPCAVGLALNPDPTFAVVASAVSTATSGTAIASTVGAIAPGQLALVFARATAGTISAPAGYSTIYSYTTAGGDVIAAFYKVLVNGDSSVPTPGISSGTVNTLACSLVGHNLATPINTQAHTDYNAGTTTLGWPSVTPSVSNTQLFCFVAVRSVATPSSTDAALTLVKNDMATTGNGLWRVAGPSPAAATPTYAQTAGATTTASAIVVDVNSSYAIPSSPTLATPANASYSDLAANGGPFTWSNNFNTIGDSQAAYALRRKISGAGSYEYWNAGTSAWQSTIVWNSTASTSVTFAVNKWTDGNVYNWSVATQSTLGPGGSGSQGPFAADFTVVAQVPPTLVVTAPSGTTASSSPTVSWTDTLASGTSQTTYRVVVESGTYGTVPGSGTTAWDSGVVASTAASATTGVNLTNSTTYRYFVQVAETGGQTSSWAYSDVTTSFTPPATPTLTATADPGNARVTLALTNNDASSVNLGVIQFSSDGGATWATVRGTGALVIAATATSTVYDFEATLGVPRQYRAQVSGVVGGQAVASAYATAGPVTLTITSWWVKDVNNPALNLALCDAQQNVRTRKGDAVAIYPAGRTNPIVLRGPLHGADGTFRTIVKTEADRTAVLALFTAQDSILIQDPRGRQWYAEWVGDLTETPFQVDQPYYAIQRGWVEVDVPG